MSSPRYVGGASPSNSQLTYIPIVMFGKQHYDHCDMEVCTRRAQARTELTPSVQSGRSRSLSLNAQAI